MSYFPSSAACAPIPIFLPGFGQCTHQILPTGTTAIDLKTFFFLGFDPEDPTYSLDSADDEHLNNHLRPKKLSQIGGPEPT